MTDTGFWTGFKSVLAFVWSRMLLLPRLNRIEEAITKLDGKLDKLCTATVTMSMPTIGVLRYLVKDLGPCSQVAVHVKQLETINECIPALQELVRESRSIRAFCGSKGPLAPQYYRTNYECARPNRKNSTEIRRIFSVRSLLRDIENSKLGEVPSSIQALVDHYYLKQNGFSICPYLLREEGLKEIERAINQDVPLGFGFAIACDRKKRPFGTVLHWEIHREGLVNFSGVYVDDPQVLEKCMSFYEMIERWSTGGGEDELKGLFPKQPLRPSEGALEVADGVRE